MNSKASRLLKLYSHFQNIPTTVDAYGLSGSVKLYADRLYQRYRDRRLGIDTFGYLDHSALGLAKVYNEYEPVNYRCLDVAFQALQPIRESDVLIDYGAGKGRVMAEAARYPFGKVLGVEISHELCESARRNLAQARGLSCRNLELVEANALHYELPVEVNRIFLFNPMIGKAMDELLETIHASLLRRPRQLTIVYLQSWAGDNALDKLPWLEKTAELPLPECQYSLDRVNKIKMSLYESKWG